MYRVGVDIGGTFTDCVIVSDEGDISIGKALSTPDDYSIGVLRSVEVTAKHFGRTAPELLSETSQFVHGTTVADNALITETERVTGLITTEGFEDTLLIMRGGIGRIAGLTELEIAHQVKNEKPPQIVPRSLTLGVSERIDHRGKVILPLNSGQVEGVLSRLVKKGARSVAVCLLWSFKNPIHEKKIARIGSKFSELDVICSHEIAPMIGEYERMATTAVAAFLSPIVRGYIKNLGLELAKNGFGRKLLLMQSYGGVLLSDAVSRNPVGLIESGPAAGVKASNFLGSLLGDDDIIAADMGGTTFKVSVISEGKVTREERPVVSKYNLLYPKIGIQSIGAGGGSIAWIEPTTNVLRVGPRSAGSSPGPICYDIGGSEPTVTDADLLLGYIDPNYFLGGTMKLNLTKAKRLVYEKIASKLATDATHAAASIKRIVDSQMADLIRSVTVYRGFDPRKFVLYAYGGAAPIHAGEIARQLGICRVVVPFAASVHSALGLTFSDVVREYGKSERMTSSVSPDQINPILHNLRNEAIRDLRSDGFLSKDMELEFRLNFRYRRQTHELAVPVRFDRKLNEDDLNQLYVDYERLYEKSYGPNTAYREAGVELVKFTLTARGKLRRLPIRTGLVHQRGNESGKGYRRIFCESERDWVRAKIYDYQALKEGEEFKYPAIIEAPTTTVVVYPGQKAAIDAYRNVIISSG